MIAFPLAVSSVTLMLLAENPPLPSLDTILEAVFEDVAVVAELGIFVSDAPEPENVVAVTIFAAKDPAASLDTILDAPLDDDAVVLEFERVPDVMLFASTSVTPEPLPTKVALTVVAFTTLVVNDPEASLETMVDAPLEDDAVVLAFATVPDEILEPFSAVKAEPSPENDVPVIAPAAKAPEASLETIVDAPFDDDALVLAFAKVPDVICDASSEVKPEPFPVIVVALITFAAKFPLASLDTIADGVFVDVAVVRPLSKVPDVTCEAFNDVSDEPSPDIEVAVIAPALKAPAASLETMVDAPLADAAVVAEFGIFVSDAPEPENTVAVI